MKKPETWERAVMVKPPRIAVQAYRDVLERLWLIEPLLGWLLSRNR